METIKLINMNRQSRESSNLASIGYGIENKFLKIEKVLSAYINQNLRIKFI
jgi:hypothetical protein